VLFVAVRGKASVREITEVADKRVRRAIESTPGVGQVMLLGGRKRQINLLLDAEALRAHSLTALDVQRALAAQNLSTPGGTVQTGPRDLTLRVQGRVETPAELGRIVVRQVADHPVRVQDVAHVQDGEREPDTAASVDGDPSVLLAIQKQSGENTVAVVDAVRDRLGRIEKSLPGDYKDEVVRDQSGTIRTQVRAVKEHLVLGALFAAVVVLLCSQVLGALAGEVMRSLKWRAKRVLGLNSIKDAHTGTVTVVQRVDSSLRLNVHFHWLALDGVCVRQADGALAWHSLPTR
jgi:HAE1 family hydrophobic/amphiphilic exporter-1